MIEKTEILMLILTAAKFTALLIFFFISREMWADSGQTEKKHRRYMNLSSSNDPRTNLSCSIATVATQ